MTYRELIELYRTGKLSEEQKRQVEADIERQEAISEYLFETEEIPGLEDLNTASSWRGEAGQEEVQQKKGSIRCETRKEQNEASDAMEEKFVKMVRGSIRRAFFKMGIYVGLVLVIIILFIIFYLPKVVDQFYYQPDEIVAQDEYGMTNRMSLDFSVYSELFLPGRYRNNVMVNSDGYGEYDITIIQNISYSGRFHNVAGKVEKGKLVLYDANLISIPSSNYFVPRKAGVNVVDMMGSGGTKEEAYGKLKTLDKESHYSAYITLSGVMTYTEFREWFDGLDMELPGVWCAVAEAKEIYYVSEHMGFSYGLGGMLMQYDEKKYPLLSLIGAEVEENAIQTHFVSMLRYMAEQKEFCQMVGLEDGRVDWEGIASEVEKNGLHIYGFAVQAKPDALIALSEMDEVCYIYTTPLQ